MRAQSGSKVQGSQEHASGHMCGTLQSVASPTQTWQGLMQQTLLQGAGGCMHNKAVTYKALRSMLASLGDPYTEFLWPSQVLLILCMQHLDVMPV